MANLVKIALCGIIGVGFLSAGSILSKGYLARRAYNHRCQKATRLVNETVDMDNNRIVSKEEIRPVFMCIRGQPQRPGDPDLNLEEKETWLSKQGYYWDERNKNYRQRKIVN